MESGSLAQGEGGPQPYIYPSSFVVFGGGGGEREDA